MAKYSTSEFTFEQIGLTQSLTKNLSSTLDDRLSQDYENHYHKGMSQALTQYEVKLVPVLTSILKNVYSHLDEIEINRYLYRSGHICIDITFKDKRPRNLEKKLKEIVTKHKLNEI